MADDGQTATRILTPAAEQSPSGVLAGMQPRSRGKSFQPIEAVQRSLNPLSKMTPYPGHEAGAMGADGLEPRLSGPIEGMPLDLTDLPQGRDASVHVCAELSRTDCKKGHPRRVLER